MSVNHTVSSASTKGKAPIGVATHESAIADPAIVGPQTNDEDIFVLAGKLEAILKGKSNKTCLKVMNMVGSLHGIRCIPSDRPIGQSTVGTTRVEPAVKPREKGKPTPPAAWKQTDNYRCLAAERLDLVSKVKVQPDGEDKNLLLDQLRESEQKLKALKSRSSGDH